jgi:hypothetical protein
MSCHGFENGEYFSVQDTGEKIIFKSKTKIKKAVLNLSCRQKFSEFQIPALIIYS